MTVCVTEKETAKMTIAYNGWIEALGKSEKYKFSQPDWTWIDDPTEAEKVNRDILPIRARGRLTSRFPGSKIRWGSREVPQDLFIHTNSPRISSKPLWLLDKWSSSPGPRSKISSKIRLAAGRWMQGIGE